jgi:flagellar hook-length control protein FliK
MAAAPQAADAVANVVLNIVDAPIVTATPAVPAAPTQTVAPPQPAVPAQTAAPIAPAKPTAASGAPLAAASPAPTTAAPTSTPTAPATAQRATKTTPTQDCDTTRADASDAQSAKGEGASDALNQTQPFIVSLVTASPSMAPKATTAPKPADTDGGKGDLFADAKLGDAKAKGPANGPPAGKAQSANAAIQNAAGGDRRPASAALIAAAGGDNASAMPGSAAQQTAAIGHGAHDIRFASADHPPAAARPAIFAPPAASFLAQHIARRFDGGAANFEVRLDPPELGRVDVRLSVDKDKRVTASIAADNPQTLADLRGAARELTRALTDAGLNLADNGLNFDLSDRSQTTGQQEAQAGTAARAASSAEDPAAPAALAARPFGVERWGGARVDLWV